MTAPVRLSPPKGPEIAIGAGHPLVLIGGPCVIESEEHLLGLGARIQAEAQKAGVPFVLKASYDKANRSSPDSYRGPGLEAGLGILARARRELGLPVLTDVHSVAEVGPAAAVVDVLQIPAFLCRQTDLLVATAKTGRPVNLKKGQFLAPEDMRGAAAKVRRNGSGGLLLTERGTTFGYHNLVVDMRSLVILRKVAPVIFDATHSVQLPGGLGEASGGQREFIRPLARAAVAVGVDAVFFEIHDDPAQALCDGPNMLPLEGLASLLAELRAIDNLARQR